MPTNLQVPRLMAAAAAVTCSIGIAAVSFATLSMRAALASCLLGWAMQAVAAIDARRFIIPDAVCLPAIPLGLVASGALLDPLQDRIISLDHLIGAGLGGAGFWLLREAYWRLRHREGLGMGDVKLAAAAGAWIGWEHLPDAVLLAGAAALSVAVALALLTRRSLSGRERIPFGAFLAPAIWGVWWLRALAQAQ
ncbi:MAG: prepilin peptidase [Hyphomicrobiaceae bacterium]|nr:prepilin peptidase [Hyphomicrobiaceae bacterium]